MMTKRQRRVSQKLWQREYSASHKKERHLYYMRNREKLKAAVLLWRTEHPRRWRALAKKWNDLHSTKEYRSLKKALYEQLKLNVFTTYSKGTPKCACCGESHMKHLSIDHAKGDGWKHRRTMKGNIYKWLTENNYPPGFRVLCFNCNLAMGFFGTCGHQDEGTSNLPK